MKALTQGMKAAPLLEPTEEHTDDAIHKALCQLKVWPKIATVKVDGIRGLRTTDLVSVRNILIPNESIRRRSMVYPYGFDCELHNPDLQYDEIESIVMSEEHEHSDKIQFHPIDLYSEMGYLDRVTLVGQVHNIFIETFPCYHPDSLMELFLKVEQEQGEGVCFRSADSPYKQGRSTLNEEYLIKLCRYTREEVTIVSCYEQMLNKNRKHSSNIGTSKRSRSIGAMVGKDTLGGFWVTDKNGVAFKVGTGVGLTESRRQQLWERQDELIGKQITIKAKSHGKKVKPRSPVFVGFREEGF
jgi:DNA ligase-1